MGCDYKIYGSITLRRSQKVDLLLEALRERLDDEAVEVETLDENTIDRCLEGCERARYVASAAVAYRRYSPAAL
jgi:hypothetical protein